MKTFHFAMKAVMIGASVVIGPALFAQVAPQPVASAPDQTLGLMRMMPSNVMMYVDVNVPVGEKFINQVKDTQLGKDIQAALLASNPNLTRQIPMMMAMTQGFGDDLGLGIMEPEQPDNPPPAEPGGAPVAKKSPPPDMILIVPVVNQVQVSTEVQMAAAVLAANTKMVWKDEQEGDVTIHVAAGDVPPGPYRPAYALAPGALIVSTSPSLVHSVLRVMSGAEKSLADGPNVQLLLDRVDQTGFAWGYVNPSAMTDLQQQTTGQIGPASIAGLSEMMKAYQGSALSISLEPTQIRIRQVQGWDPASDIGKLLRTLQPATIQTPNLAFGKTTLFVDLGDNVHFSTIFDQTIRPFFKSLIAMAADSPATKEYITPFSGLFQAVDDIIHGAGGEVALDVGPIAGNASPIPPILVMAQDGISPKLKAGFDGLMSSISTITHQKWYPKNVDGASVKLLGDTTFPVRLVFGLTGGYYTLASDLNSFKTPLYHSRGVNPNTSLSANPLFKGALGDLGPQFISFSYLNILNLADLGIFKPAAKKQTNASDVKGPNDATQTERSPLENCFYELLGDLRMLALATHPDTVGIASQAVLTFDLNAGPPSEVVVGAGQ